MFNIKALKKKLIFTPRKREQAFFLHVYFLVSAQHSMLMVLVHENLVQFIFYIKNTHRQNLQRPSPSPFPLPSTCFNETVKWHLIMSPLMYIILSLLGHIWVAWRVLLHHHQLFSSPRVFHDHWSREQIMKQEWERKKLYALVALMITLVSPLRLFFSSGVAWKKLQQLFHLCYPWLFFAWKKNISW